MNPKSDTNLSTKIYKWLIQLILGGWFFKEKTTQSPNKHVQQGNKYPIMLFPQHVFRM